jgi:hypothetical protein
MARILHAAKRRHLRGWVMPNSGRPWQKLHALAVAIEAAEQREPYPKLARLMDSLAASRTGMRFASARPSYG